MRKFLAIIVLVMIASLCVAGCITTNTSNSLPTETQGPSAQAITDSYVSGGYDIVTPFVKSTNQYGNDFYAGIVRENSSTHVHPFEHNITIEVMKSKNETTERATQLKAVYSNQGYYITNLSSNMNYVSKSNDPTGTHQLVIGLCDPNMGCIPYTFNHFTVIVDQETKLE